jgi:hypothetical protein
MMPLIMFEEEKTSLGELDETELSLAVKHLDGESFEDIFEECVGEGEEPPAWLLKWSEFWSWEPLFTIGGLDPLSMSCYLIEDSSCDEFWICDKGCDDQPVIMNVPTDSGDPSVEDVSNAAIAYLRKAGDAMLYGDLSIDSPTWLPREQMKDFMSKMMEENDVNTAGGEEELNLEEWLDREYGSSN